MMKKNRQMTNQMKGIFFLMLPLLLASCGSFQATSYYGDGIYGEEIPIERTEIVLYEDTNSKGSGVDPDHYRNYVNELASQANEKNDYTYFTDVDSYNTTPAPNNRSYAGWGQNTSRGNVTVNVYDNYYNRWGYDPYYDWNYGSNYYWGMGAWSPYYRSSWGYYGPRNRVSFGFGWSSGWNYPYYGYEPYYYGYNYYGYRPYYYGYAYDPYYYGGGYYPYYGRSVYYNPKNYAHIKGRRGGNGNYNSGTRGNYNNQRAYTRRDGQSDNSYERTYGRRTYSRGAGTYTPAQSTRTYSRSSNNSSNSTPSSGRVYQRSSTPSSNRSYERSSDSSSGRTYTPRSSSSSRSYGSGSSSSSGRRGR